MKKLPKNYTIQEKLATVMAAHGWPEKPKMAGGCRVFQRPADGNFFYVGKAGSLRRGVTRSSSRPVREEFKNSMLKMFEEGLEPTVEQSSTQKVA